MITSTSGTERAFDRDVFLLRQKALRISTKYDVCDEEGNKILYIERPAHMLRSIAALLGAIAAFGVVVGGSFVLFSRLPDRIMPVVGGVSVFVAFGALVVTAILLSAKRHVTFYRDATKQERLLEIIQDRKFQPITMTYTVRDPDGNTIALLWKNWLYNIVRKRWYVKAPDGTVIYVAKEDSILLSLLRRFLGPMLGILRTNFVIMKPDSEEEIGEFNRKFTILDRYSLDMKGDTSRLMDRRIALALGVMLDTGERR